MTAQMKVLNDALALDLAKSLKTVEQGAATSVWCATSPQLDSMGGVYLPEWRHQEGMT